MRPYIVRIRQSAKLFVLALLCLAPLSLGALGAGSAAAASLPATDFAAASTSAADQCAGGFFGLEPWYHFMPDSEIGVNKIGDAPTDKCGIKCFNIFVQSDNAPNECGETASDVPGVILAVIDDLLRISALVAVAFIIKGSFEFVGSRGNSERTAAAQSSVITALTGLAVSLVAVGLVSFIGTQLH